MNLREKLTRREREIVLSAMEDKRQKEIAFELGMSEKTLNTHLANIYQKIGVKSRIGLIRVVYSDFSYQGHITDNE